VTGTETALPLSHEDTSTEERPWGTFNVLAEANNFKVKRIEVFPGKRLSYQRHARRSEHWFLTDGTAKVTLNDREILLKSGESVDIPTGTKHRVENPHASETLVFIEIQTGDYFGEDDIERFEDDYGRTA
jgi:mannose-6-phosphate isomerase-like protein (cupin superfamily)